MNPTWLWKRGLSVLVASLFIAACGGGEEEELEETPEVECGPGTVLQDRQCVLAEFDCPEGEVPTPIGSCASPSVFCGPGASFDSELEFCVSTAEIACGPGTVESGGRCIVEDAKVCTAGTVLADGQCVIAASVCGTGTRLEGAQCEVDESACRGRTEFDVILGVCVDSAQVSCGEGTLEQNNRCIPYYTEADLLAAQADVDYSLGNTINLGSTPGDQVIFKGTMNPGGLFHTYTTQGVRGQWLKITLYTRGLPSPGFRIREAIGTWERRVTPGFVAVPERTFLVPNNANLDLIISTNVSGVSGTFGSGDWNYVGIIEVVEPPQPRVWDVYNETLQGDLAHTTDNFLEVQVPDGTQALITPEVLGVDAAQPVVEIWDTPTTYGSRQTIEEGLGLTLDGSTATKYLLVDAQELRGPRTNFSLSATETFPLASGVTTTEEIFAEAGQMIYISHRNNSQTTLAGRVVRNGEVLYSTNSLLASNRTSYAASQTRRDFFYVPETGTYQVQIENTTSNTINGFLQTSSAQSVPKFTGDASEPTSFSTNFSTSPLTQGSWRFVVVESQGSFRVQGQVSTTSGTPHVSVFSLGRNQLFNFTSSGSTQNVDFTVNEAGTYIMAIRPSTSLSGGVQVELEGTPLDSLAPGDSIVHTFDASTFDILYGEVSYVQGGAPDVRLTNEAGGVVFEHTPMSGSTRRLLELLPGNGEFTLEVTNNSSSSTVGINVRADVATPGFYLDRSEAFLETSSGSLSEGESAFYMIRTRSDFNHQVILDIDETEEASLRFWDLNTRTTLFNNSGEELVSGLLPELASGFHLVEVEAITDIADYLLTWQATVSQSFELTHATFEISGFTTVDGDLEVAGCLLINSIEVVLDFPTNSLFRIDLDIWLTAPNGEVYEIWDLVSGSTSPSNAFASGEFVFPTNFPPVDSFDPLLGTSGDGTWNLEIQHSWTSSGPVIWTLRLNC